MSLTIGSIVIKDVENLKWSSRRQNDIISIPYGSQINNTNGVELVEYQISGAIFSDTVAPKLLRRQLTELFENSSRDFTYIEFSEDSNELTGWFLLDSFSTEIIPSTFHYNFDMTVRRLSLDKAQMVALYAQDDTPLVSDYSLTPATRRWVAMPNGEGDSSHLLRTGDEGTTRVPIDSVIHYMPYTQTSVVNDFRCRVYDTMTPQSMRNFTISSNFTESDWEERYGIGNNFTGDVIISNGLIRIVYVSPGFRKARSPVEAQYQLHVWSGTDWILAGYDFIPIYGVSTFRETPLIFGFPTITHFTNNKIEFIQGYLAPNIDNPSGGIDIYYGVKSTLYFGSYFISKTMNIRGDDLAGFTSPLEGLSSHTKIAETASITTDNYSSIQFQASNGFNFNLGFLYTRIPTPPLTSGKTLLLAYAALQDTFFQVGVFILPNPPSAGTTLANIGREYLSNSTQKRVLINPKWM